MNINRSSKTAASAWPNRIWQRLTEPATALQKAAEQRQARLLASILVGLIPLGTLSITIQLFTVPNFAPTFRAVFLGIVILTIAYLLSRTVQYRWGAGLAAVIPAIASLLTIIANPADMIAFGFLLFGILLGSMFLSLRATIFLAAANVIGILLLPFLTPALMFVDLVAPFMFVFISLSLILIAAHHRNLIEQDRQTELQASEARFRDLFNQAPDAIIISDKTQQILDVNAAACQLYGYERADFLRMHVPDLIALESRATHQERMKNRTDGNETNEGLALHRAGHTIPVEIRSGPLRGSEPGLHLAIVRELSDRQKVVGDLITANQLLEATQRSARIGSWSFDLKRQRGTWSQEMFRIYELDPEQGAPSMNIFLEMVHPDDRERVKVAQSQTPQASESDKIDFRLKLANGTIKEVTASSFPHPADPSGTTLIGTVQDISERRQLEEEIRRQRDFFAQVMHALGQGVTVVDKELKFEYVNAAYATMIGLSPAQLIGDSPLNHVSPEGQTAMEEAVKARQTGQPSTYETTIQRMDNQILHILVTGTPRWEDGQVNGTIAAVTDITEQKKIEERLRQSEAFHRTVLENSFDGVVIIDAEGVIRYANPTLAEILGYSPEEVVGQPTGSFIHPEERKEADGYYSRYVSGQTKLNQTTRRYRHKDGSVRVLETRRVNLLDNPVVKGVLSSFHDITIQIEAVEAVQKLNAELEQRVDERTAELRQFVNAMAGREVRMAELKEVIQQLRSQLQAAGLTPVANDPLAE